MNPAALFPEAGSPSPSPPEPARPAKLGKKILALTLIFFLGVGTGAVGSVALILHSVLRHEAVSHWSERRLDELGDRLKLTAEQKEKLKPVVTRAGERFQAIGNQTFDEIVSASEDARAEVEKELDPKQQKEFEKMRPLVIAKLREWVQKQMVARQTSGATPAPPKPAPATPSPEEPTPANENAKAGGT